MGIDDRIKKLNAELHQLEAERAWFKIQINSTYGTDPLKDPTGLFEKRNNITKEMKKLHLIKNRHLKLDKIIKRNEESMEV